MYANMFGLDMDKIMKKLWGENFFSPKTKKWSMSKEDNKRSFCKYVLDPIYMVFDTIVNFKKEETAKLLSKLSTADGKAVKDLLKVIKDIYYCLILIGTGKYGQICIFTSEPLELTVLLCLIKKNPS
jgi:hypothetical protein